GLHGGLVRYLAIAHPHGAGRGDRGLLHHPQHLQGEIGRVLHSLPMEHHTGLPLADPTERALALFAALPRGTDVVVGTRPEAFQRAAAEADVILHWSGSGAVLAEVLRMAPRVKWVHARSAGLDGILSPELVENPAVLTNARGVFSAS